MSGVQIQTHVVLSRKGSLNRSHFICKHFKSGPFCDSPGFYDVLKMKYFSFPFYLDFLFFHAPSGQCHLAIFVASSILETGFNDRLFWRSFISLSFARRLDDQL